jgi:uncharacterized protein (TIGR01777 family)
VAALSRDPVSAIAKLPTSVTTHAWNDVPENLNAVVHLAGASIAGGRWSAARKAALRSSRVDATQSLIAALAAACETGRSGSAPLAFVSASGMGYYGDRGEALVRAEDPPGHDFLGSLAAEWEGAASLAAAEPLGARVVIVRLGMILGNGGGALPKMTLPFRLGLGAVMGSGRQYWPWIHLTDAAELFFRAATDPDFRGPVHGVAGEPVTQQEFSRILAETLRRPLWLRIPSWALRLGAGEMADLFLHGQRAEADPHVVLRHPTLNEALHNLLSTSR